MERQVRANEPLVRVTLMQADLEFEYPQKLEKLMIRSDMLKWLDEEEHKLRELVMEPEYISDSQANLPPMPEAHDGSPVLTLEDYYSIPDDITMSLVASRKSLINQKMPFDEWAADHASENIFDNDVSFWQ